MSSVGESSINFPVVETKPTNSNSDILANFDVCLMSNNSKKARCKTCGLFFKHDSNSSLRNHVYEGCSVVKAAMGSMGVDGSLWQYDVARVHDRMTKYVIQETLPFDHFDNKRMTSLIQETLQPRYCHVSRATLRHDCIKLWKLAKDELILGFQSLETGVNLTCDVWTAPHDSPETYLCVTAHWVNPKTWVMMKRVISFELFTSENLYAILVDVIKTYNLQEKVFSISFDDASNNTTTVEKLSLKYKPLCNGVFFHSRCVTRIISLVVQVGLSVMEPTINGFKNMLSDIFSVSNKRYKRYMKLCQDKNAIFLGPNWDVQTPWNSTCNMFDCALRQKNTLKMFHDQLAHHNLVESYPESSWETIELVLEMLDVFKKATTLLSGVYYPTNCLVLNQLYVIARKLNEFGTRSVLFANMVKPMKEKLKKYFKEFSPLITCATALNPILNQSGVEYLIMDIATNLGLTDDDTSYVPRQIARFNEAFDNMFQVYLNKYLSSSIFHSTHQEADSNSSGFDASMKIFNLLRSESLKRDRCNATSELERYQTSNFLAQRTVEELVNFDVLGWWKKWGASFPVLSIMASDLLSVQASTVALESAFSESGRVISPRRSKLTPVSIEVCICLKDHLDSMERIQHISPLEGDLERVEEEIYAEEIATRIAEPCDEDEIANFNQDE